MWLNNSHNNNENLFEKKKQKTPSYSTGYDTGKRNVDERRRWRRRMWKIASNTHYTLWNDPKKPEVKKQLVVIKSKWKSPSFAIEIEITQSKDSQFKWNLTLSPIGHQIQTTKESICFFPNGICAKDSKVWRCHCCFGLCFGFSFNLCFCFGWCFNAVAVLVESTFDPMWNVDWNFNCTFQSSFIQMLVSVF